MNKHSSYVHTGLPYRSVMEQSNDVCINSPVQYYPVTNSVNLPSEGHSAPTYLSQLKAIANHLSALDARADAEENGEAKYEDQCLSKNITPTVGTPPPLVVEALEELTSNADCRDKLVAPVAYPNNLMAGIPTKPETKSADNDEEYINVVDIDENDSTPLVPTSMANSSYFSELLQGETHVGKLAKLVQAFKEKSKFKESSASRNLECSNSVTPPLSDSEAENQNDTSPEIPSAASSTARCEESPIMATRNTSYVEILKKLVEITKIKMKQRSSANCSTDVSTEDSVASSLALGNAEHPPRPLAEPLREGRPSQVNDEEQPTTQTFPYPKRLKQMRNDNPGMRAAARSTSTWPWSGLHSVSPYAELQATSAPEPFTTQAVSYTTEAFQAATGAPSSYTSRTSLAHAAPPASAELGTTAAGTSPWSWPGLQTVSPYEQATYAAERFGTQATIPQVATGTLPSYLRGTSLAYETPYSRTPIGATAIHTTAGRVSSHAGSRLAREANNIEEQFQNARRNFESPMSRVSHQTTPRVSSQFDYTHDTYKIDKFTQPLPVFLRIGARGTLVRQDFYDLILWDDCVRCTKMLMEFIFEFHSMATLTVDGPDQLDPNIVHDIATHVSFKFDVPVQQVLNIMRHICMLCRQNEFQRIK